LAIVAMSPAIPEDLVVTVLAAIPVYGDSI